jgi:hypothetical protein
MINPWITEQKNFLLLRNWIRFVPIFFKLSSQLFFKIRLIDAIEVKPLRLFKFLICYAVI